MLGVLLAGPARSDVLRPGYLEIRQTAPDTYDLLFKIPALGDDLRLGIYVDLPEGTTRRSTSARGVQQRRLYRTSHHPAGGRAGRTGRRNPGAFGNLNRRAGAHRNSRRRGADRTADADQDVVRRSGQPGAGDVAASYLRLGVEHILFGFDHLLFVLALVILVRDWRRVALTVTAFTVAHSITLAAATLGFVSVPGPPIEAAIALSIVLVAVEIVNARRGRPSDGALSVARRLLSSVFCTALALPALWPKWDCRITRSRSRFCSSILAWKLGSWPSWPRF